MDNVFCRVLKGNDWQDFKDLRLQALSEFPHFFCPSRNEFEFEKSDWLARLNNPNSAVFGLYFGEDVAGIGAVIRKGNQSSSDIATLNMSYIAKKYRSRGLSTFLYEARLLWAKEQNNIKSVEIEHREDNISCFHAHQKFGFEFLSRESEQWSDGEILDCVVYVKHL